MKFLINIIVCMLFVCCQTTRGQIGRDFRFYTFYDRYDNNTKEYLSKNGYIEATLITPFYIDPHNTGKVDLTYVKRYIEKIYPDANQKGVCVVNWEDKLYQNMIKLKGGDRSFIRASSEFEKLVNYIKKLRPNVKVGVYGFPVRVVSGRSPNAETKFDALFRVCDFISPSLYLMYTDEEKGHDWNQKYFAKNLDLAYQYSKRLNKPVIPFVWHKIHPNNKSAGMKAIPINVMKSYLEYLYQYRGNMISGIFWWDAKPQSGNAEKIKRTGGNQAIIAKTLEDKSISELIVEYTGELNKKIKK